MPLPLALIVAWSFACTPRPSLPSWSGALLCYARTQAFASKTPNASSRAPFSSARKGCMQSHTRPKQLSAGNLLPAPGISAVASIRHGSCIGCRHWRSFHASSSRLRGARVNRTSTRTVAGRPQTVEQDLQHAPKARVLTRHCTRRPSVQTCALCCSRVRARTPAKAMQKRK